MQDRDETIAKIDAQNTPTNAWYRAGQMLMTPSGFSSASDQDENHVTGFTGHAGIIARNGRTIIEAGKDPAGGLNVHRAYDTWNERYSKCYGLGCRYTSNETDYNVASWAEQQVGKPYNLIALQNPYRTDCYICSSLVLCSYYYAGGVDLKDSGMWTFIPDDLLKSSKTFVEWSQG